MEKLDQMLASFPTNKLLILRFIILKMWENCNIKQSSMDFTVQQYSRQASIYFSISSCLALNLASRSWGSTFWPEVILPTLKNRFLRLQTSSSALTTAFRLPLPEFPVAAYCVRSSPWAFSFQGMSSVSRQIQSVS